MRLMESIARYHYYPYCFKLALINYQHWHRTAFRRTKLFSPRTPEQRSAFGRTPFGRTKHRTSNNPIPNTEHRTRLESSDLLRQPNPKQTFSLNTEQKRSPNNAFDSEHVQMPESLPEHRTAFSEHRTAFGDSLDLNAFCLIRLKDLSRFHLPIRIS